MSKRASANDLSDRPIKLAKGVNVWSSIPDDDEEKSKEFKPVEGGPKTKLPKTFTLNYKLRMNVTITLNGCQPVRFTGADGIFYKTGEEFLDISGVRRARDPWTWCVWTTEDDGFRLAGYQCTESVCMPSFP